MKALNSIILLVSLICTLTFCCSILMANESAIDKIHPWLLDKAKNGNEIEFIVKMKARPDLSLAYKIKDKENRVRYVYQTLLKAANESQEELRRSLESRGISYRWFYTTNALLVKGNLNLIYEIAQRDDVEGIYGNPEIKHILPVPEDEILTPAKFLDELLAIEWNVNKVKAPQVWAMGHRGEGVVVGAQDTGYRWTHAAVKNQYRGWNGTTADHNYNWHDSIHPPASGGSCGTDSPVPCDDDGHGTHTIGTVLGSDYNPGSGQNCTSTTTNQIGVAPCARWIGCRNMDQGTGTPARYIECFDFFLAPYPVGGNPNQGDPSKAPDLTTNSWGCPSSEGCSWNTLQDSVNAHYAAGIMFVAAAGNDGSSCGSVNDPPALYQNTYTIGSTTSTDSMSSFSSRGPADYTNLMKPNVVTPGSNVRSSYNSSDTAYTTMSGTSMATPCAAGVVTLLWSCFPTMKNDIPTTMNVLNSTATRLTSIVESCGGDYVNGPNNTWGYGLLNAQAACQYCTPPAAPTGLTATTPANNTIRLTWNASSGATSYKIYRADGTDCPGGTYVYIDSVTSTTYDDTNVSGGVTYAYVVRASNVCDSPDSNCAQATATGQCTMSPTFAGLQSATNSQQSTCQINLSWNAATSNCSTGPNITYHIYRSTDPNFEPSSANRIASCITGTSYIDTNVEYGTTYYYIVRSEDSTNSGTGPCNNGNSDTNTVKKSTSPTGPTQPGSYAENWESGSSDWTMSGLWHLTTEAAQNCMQEPYPSSATVAYYGQDSTCNYNTGSTTSGNLDKISYIAGISSSSNLNFMFVNGNEGDSSYDISYVYVSPNGTTWTQVWTWAGTQQSTWASSGNISLSSWAGQSLILRLRFDSVDSMYNSYLGWAVDNINVTNVQVPSSCTTSGGAPGRILNNLTVAKNGNYLTLTWQAPGGTCQITGYGLYRGTLPFTSYNHESIACNLTSTTTSTAQQSGSNYYLIVPMNEIGEGSYGINTSAQQIPQGSNPCNSNQILTECN